MKISTKKIILKTFEIYEKRRYLITIERSIIKENQTKTKISCGRNP